MGLLWSYGNDVGVVGTLAAIGLALMLGAVFWFGWKLAYENVFALPFRTFAGATWPGIAGFAGTRVRLALQDVGDRTIREVSGIIVSAERDRMDQVWYVVQVDQPRGSWGRGPSLLQLTPAEYALTDVIGDSLSGGLPVRVLVQSVKKGRVPLLQFARRNDMGAYRRTRDEYGATSGILTREPEGGWPGYGPVVER